MFGLQSYYDFLGVQETGISCYIYVCYIILFIIIITILFFYYLLLIIVLLQIIYIIV